MPTLSSYTNVFNTCLLLLRERGWRSWVVEKGTDRERFWAEQNGWDLVADSPVELLGLVVIHESKKPSEYTEYWWREEGPDLYGRMPSKPPKYRSRARKGRGTPPRGLTARSSRRRR